MPTIFKINKNQPDSQQMSPRAVMAILPFEYTEVNPIRVVVQNDVQIDTNRNNVALRVSQPLLLAPSEILSLAITEDKKTPMGTLSATLQPSKFNYLAACNPGDYIFAWICPTLSLADELRAKILKGEQCNLAKYGFKFFGKIYSTEEMFNINNGVKTVRYAVSAQSFDYYQTEIFNTPEALPFQDNVDSMIMYERKFFENIINALTQGQNSQIFTNILYTAQDQISYLHQAFMGAKGSDVPGDALFKSWPNMFELPPMVGKLFGRDVQNQNKSNPLTFSDIMNVIVGVQDYSSQSEVDFVDAEGNRVTGGSQSNENTKDSIGPNFTEKVVANAGKLYVPNNASFNLKGIRLLNITPSMAGTIWSILKEHSNPLLNEMYTCFRASPSDNNAIFPTFVCRQMPFSYNAPTNNFGVTYFDELPRFRIDPSQVMAYSLNKCNELRHNLFYVQPIGYTDWSNQLNEDAFTLANIGYQIDAQDGRKHGIRRFTSQVYENFNASKALDQQKLGQYTQFIRDINSNLHLKLTGQLTTWGISDLICIGENLQLGDELLFHIEKITHTYSIQAGIPIFRTSFDLSYGMALNPKTLFTKGHTVSPVGNNPIYTQFHPDYNFFTASKADANLVPDETVNSIIKGNSFSIASPPADSDASQDPNNLLSQTNPKAEK